MSPLQPLEPETRAALEAALESGAPQPFELPVAEARAAFAALMARAPATLAAEIEDFVIGSPVGPVSLRLVRPEGVRAQLPIVVYLHGGGWVLGGKAPHDRFTRELAHAARAAVLFVDYSLAPEARFPIAIEQSYAAVLWAASRDPRLALAGDSAGGNMAAAVTLLARERGGPPIRQQTLICPVMDARFDTPSYRQFARGYFLGREGMQWFWGHYLPADVRPDHKLVSPLRAPVGDLRGLPPALVVTAECDVLRDEGEAYARKLMAARVPVTASRFLGTVHNFIMPPALYRSRPARAAMSLIGAALFEALA